MGKFYGRQARPVQCIASPEFQAGSCYFLFRSTFAKGIDSWAFSLRKTKRRATDHYGVSVNELACRIGGACSYCYEDDSAEAHVACWSLAELMKEVAEVVDGMPRSLNDSHREHIRRQAVKVGAEFPPLSLCHKSMMEEWPDLFGGHYDRLLSKIRENADPSDDEADSESNAEEE